MVIDPRPQHDADADQRDDQQRPFGHFQIRRDGKQRCGGRLQRFLQSLDGSSTQRTCRCDLTAFDGTGGL